MVNTIKFSQMTVGGDISNNDQTPGLLGGGNVLFNNPWTFLPPGTTGDRPVPTPDNYYRLRLNTTLQVYEYFDEGSMIWAQLSGTGTGTVNPGSVNDMAYYAAAGQAVSPLTSAPSSVLVTNASSVPSLSNILPVGLNIPSATITASTAALLSGSVAATPVSGTDIANKSYVDSSFSNTVNSATGTANQVLVNGTFGSPVTGAITLALPQDIATGSTPTFLGLTLTSTPLSVSSGGTGDSQFLPYGVICGGTGISSPFRSVASVGTAGQFLVSNGAGALPTFQTVAVGSGTVSSGTINQLAWYSATGNVVSGLATAVSGVLVTNSFGVPGFSGSLPNGLNMGTPTALTLTNATGLVPSTGLATTSGTPSSSTFLRGDNTWQSLSGLAVTSITGTANRVLANGTSGTPQTGPVTLSAPQDIATTSSPTFASLTLTTPLAVASGGTGVSSVTVTPTATSFAGWNADKNLSSNNFLAALTSVTSSIFTQLTRASTQQWLITGGASTPTFGMPDVGTLAAVGHSFTFINVTGNLTTISTFTGTIILTMIPNTVATITYTGTAGNVAASWAISYNGSMPVLSLTGTANQVLVNGTSGSAQGGSITLTLPQNINTTAAVQFNTVRLNGSALLGSNGGTVLSFTDNSTAINSVSIANAVSGSPPIIQAVGSTNLVLSLQGNGTGGVRVQGSTDGSNATAGYEGELISSIIPNSSAVSLTSGTAANITSITIPAGDWDLWGNVSFNFGGTGTSNLAYGWMSATSATLPSPELYAGINANVSTLFGPGNNYAIAVPGRRFVITSSTTYYLSALYQQITATATATASGGIYARRRR